MVPESLKFISQEEIDCYRLAAEAKAEEAGKAIKQLVDEKLFDKGAVLIRGLLPVFPTNKEFGILVEKMGKSFTYSAGTASRAHDPDAEGHGEVMFGADEPPEVTIEMHLEMSYNRDMPARIYFYCHKAPSVENGGAVPVCNMRKVYQQLKKAGNKDVEDIMENGLRYMRTLHSRDTPEGALYSWQKTFPGQSRKEVEESLEKLGFDQHEWLENGALRYSHHMRAVRPHPKFGDPVWTNQASICHGSYYFAIPDNLVEDPRLGPTHTTHANGRELSQGTLDLIRGVQWQVCRGHQWAPGDLVVLDNFTNSHGRMAWNGKKSDRKLGVALTY